MNILKELTELMAYLGISVETGIFSGVAPQEYVVITPLADSFTLFGDNRAEWETQDARLSLYSKGNYLDTKERMVHLLLDSDFTITNRVYISHEDDTRYHHYAIDVAKIYPLEV